MFKTACSIMLTAALTVGCTTSGGSVNTANSIDAVCKLEPAAYLAFQVYASIKHVSTVAKRRVEQAHITASQLCYDRPADLETTLSSLNKAYAQIIIETGIK